MQLTLSEDDEAPSQSITDPADPSTETNTDLELDNDEDWSDEEDKVDKTLYSYFRAATQLYQVRHHPIVYLAKTNRPQDTIQLHTGTGIPPPVNGLLRGEPIDNFHVILRANVAIFKEVVAVLSQHKGVALKELGDYVTHAVE
jgi:hypothetical protein